MENNKLKEMLKNKNTLLIIAVFCPIHPVPACFSEK